MSVNPTYPPRERVEWAYKRSRELQEFHLAFANKHPYQFAPDRDPKTGDHLGRLQIRPPFPDEVSFMIGDIVHNLRAAMDNAIWLLRDAKVTDDRLLRHVAFKIANVNHASGPEQDWLSFRGKVASTIPGPVLDEMYKFQPHVSGRTELTTLDPLWNGDKHRAPHVAFARIAMIGAGVTGDASTPDDVSFEDGPFQDGDVVVRIRDSLGAEPHFESNPAMFPAFDEIGPGRGEPIFDLLDRLKRYVADEVIPAFEHL